LIGVLQSEHFQVSCVVSSEQPSDAARIYGNKHIVVFICETALKVPPEATRSVVQCILDFAHRHRSPMIYTIEGIPKEEKFSLPTGEEVSLKLRGGDEEEGSDEDYVPEEQLMLLDDSLLAKLTIREEEAKGNDLRKSAEIKPGEKSISKSRKGVRSPPKKKEKMMKMKMRIKILIQLQRNYLVTKSTM